MEFYVVYSTSNWIDSCWLKYESAVARFKEIWGYQREPSEDEIGYHVKVMKTED